MCLMPAAGFGQSLSSRETEVKRLAQPLIDGRLVPGLVVGIYDSGRTETYGPGFPINIYQRSSVVKFVIISA